MKMKLLDRQTKSGKERERGRGGRVRYSGMDMAANCYTWAHWNNARTKLQQSCAHPHMADEHELEHFTELLPPLPAARLKRVKFKCVCVCPWRGRGLQHKTLSLQQYKPNSLARLLCAVLDDCCASLSLSACVCVCVWVGVWLLLA